MQNNFNELKKTEKRNRKAMKKKKNFQESSSRDFKEFLSRQISSTKTSHILDYTMTFFNESYCENFLNLLYSQDQRDRAGYIPLNATPMR